MTGAELIKWIQDNHAEGMDITVVNHDHIGSVFIPTDEQIEEHQFDRKQVIINYSDL